jgi:putative protease
MEAAVKAGADAVYFGLSSFNARARATNFSEGGLAETIQYLHQNGVRAYVTLNTLVFDSELPSLEAAVRACAAAGADAVIVQDLGVLRMVSEIAPTMHIHASTQMTCTDADSVAFATSLGAKRVILARELSIADIADIKKKTSAELETFVHGALCVSYSGQCLTSEAIGGRSANRGACAQACRLPYELVVDGETRDLGDVAYLLSPEDLEASALVPELIQAGVVSLKIEGRLKGPSYVAATTSLYRSAIGGTATSEMRKTALATYTRGSGPGFLAGVDHQRLVEGRSPDHRGLEIGVIKGTLRRGNRTTIELSLTDEISRGDGVLIEGAREGKGEVGGRVWEISVSGRDVTQADAGDTASLWLGPDKVVGALQAGARVFRTDDPVREKAARTVERKIGLELRLTGKVGEHPVLHATTDRGQVASVEVPAVVEHGKSAPSSAEAAHPQESAFKDKLARLGETPFQLTALTLDLPRDAFVPPSALNRARRELCTQLGKTTPHATTSVTAATLLEQARAPIATADAPSPPAGLFALCRNEAQAFAALDAGADGIILDFLELTGTGNALRALRARGPCHVTLTPPRILKPGEEKITSFLTQLGPDAMLVRGLGGLLDAASGPPRIGDFSLNVTNRLSAREVLSRGLIAFTPAFDLDAEQLVGLLDGELARFAEVVVHHPMPLFYTEHCVFAALLSQGKDHRTCGRPCDRHAVSLRDRAGMEHPVIADVGCRNTVFHARSQSAADLVPRLQALGVRRFRIELVRESAEDTGRIVRSYRDLLAGKSEPREVFKACQSEGGYGVVRGTLRVLQG